MALIIFLALIAVLIPNVLTSSAELNGTNADTKLFQLLFPGNSTTSNEAKFNKTCSKLFRIISGKGKEISVDSFSDALQNYTQRSPVSVRKADLNNDGKIEKEEFCTSFKTALDADLKDLEKLDIGTKVEVDMKVLVCNKRFGLSDDLPNICGTQAADNVQQLTKRMSKRGKIATMGLLSLGSFLAAMAMLILMFVIPGGILTALISIPAVGVLMVASIVFGILSISAAVGSSTSEKVIQGGADLLTENQKSLKQQWEAFKQKITRKLKKK